MDGFSQLDAFLYLRDSDGNLLTFDDQGGGNNDAKIIYTASVSGTYFLDAGSFLEASTGSYEITFSNLAFNDDYHDDINTTGLIEVGSNVSGELEIRGDSDWFAITLVQGTTYQFEMRGISLGDPYLYLRDSFGNEITHDDQSGGGNDAQITYTATESGTYYLDAQAFMNADNGDYQINATIISADDDYAEIYPPLVY